jgi:predicted nucleic acid-binding protein
MRIALDINILTYAEGIGDKARCEAARSFVSELPVGAVILSAQTLGELYRVLTGKAKRKADASRTAVLSWADSFEVADSTWPACQSAFDLAADHGLPVWDALILSVAAETRCRMLASEDFREGFTWRGVTVVNPFSKPRSPLIDGVVG